MADLQQTIRDSIDAAVIAGRYAGYQMALTDAVTIIARHVELSSEARMALALEIGCLTVEDRVPVPRSEPINRQILRLELAESMDGRTEPSPQLVELRERRSLGLSPAAALAIAAANMDAP